MAAETAAIPFKNSEAESAVDLGNSRRINRGEKIKPPPSPTMVRTKEARKMIKNKRGSDMICNYFDVIGFSLSTDKRVQGVQDPRVQVFIYRDLMIVFRFFSTSPMSSFIP
jgi:hypothetical protein